MNFLSEFLSYNPSIRKRKSKEEQEQLHSLRRNLYQPEVLNKRICELNTHTFDRSNELSSPLQNMEVVRLTFDILNTPALSELGL